MWRGALRTHPSDHSLMPKSWNVERILQLLTLLRSGRYNSRQLASQLGVNRRTIFRDLARLAACQVPVVYDAERQAYTMREVPLLRGLKPEHATTLAIALRLPLPGDPQPATWATVGS